MPSATISRRQLFQLGGAGGYLGLHLGGLWRAQAALGADAITSNPIRSCILIFYLLAIRN